ncbi:hypothetical protein M409DRAFT_29948 [Zasmidium cellare ATCC 36951]|uniref:ASX DEUBAD domain-containing protein n=1 Tax=Zasmidium cellare ATCC 36951 TaxID=1080233 RepID=A0A6A6C1E0_ZASCE|nr:uncharacterized protein M409DRAFT_29948 [Zasmidium cellare ATCC 36951]KAF2159629.1 hypothetical protein M409DRAFT_29948 [Zasmidium cellare ATCC 36951]
MGGVQPSQEPGTTVTPPLPRTTASDQANITPEDESTLSELDSPSDPSQSTMAASTQKRWLTQPNSKIAKADLLRILRQEDAWESLPREVRQNLYNFLPQPTEGEPAHNVDVHPLKTQYKQYIEDAIRTWQQDLIDGREVQSWREQAMQVEQDRQDGKWDDFKAYQREADWGDDGEDEDGEGNDVKNDTNGVATNGAASEDEEDSEGEEIEVKPKSYLTMGQRVTAKRVIADSDDDTASEA